MGLVVVISNYLVQFPIQHFGLSEILTYGAFSYPITFLITDLANRAYGKVVARKIVYFGHMVRRDNIQRMLIEGRVKGKRCKGRPRTEWITNVHKWTRIKSNDEM